MMPDANMPTLPECAVSPAVNPTAHLVLVEDDQALAASIQAYLEAQNYRVTLVHDGAQAEAMIQQENPDLVLLDIGLPGKNGFDICQAIRRFYTQPIVMLTANDTETDEVLGLELGADDYLTKPVRPRVLLARIQSRLRQPTPQTRLQFGQLSMDPNAKTLILNERALTLSTAEFDLLWVLASHAGTVLSRDALIHALRGIDYDGMDRTIDVRISRLRKKLGDDAAQPRKIKTIWGKGYLFVPTAWG